MIATLSALLLASAPLPRADALVADALVSTIYDHYKRPDNPVASWEYPVFTRDTGKLIERWLRGSPPDEVDSMSGADWFCLCQDWDSQVFSHEVLSRKSLGPDKAEFLVRITVFEGLSNDQRLILRREGGRWRLEDAFSEDYPKGLRQALRATIAENARNRP